MPKIHFKKNHLPDLSVTHGAQLMQSLQAAGIPVASSCGGEAVCGRCKVQIFEGAAQLGKPQEKELLTLKRLRIGPTERLACQVCVVSDVTLDTSYW